MTVSRHIRYGGEVQMLNGVALRHTEPYIAIGFSGSYSSYYFFPRWATSSYTPIRESGMTIFKTILFSFGRSTFRLEYE